MRHVQGAGHAVEHADGSEEYSRSDEVQRNIFHCPFHLVPAAAQGQKHEGGNEHDLEPDIEIEDIPGQKRAATAQQEHMVKRMISDCLVFYVGGSEGIDGHGKADQPGHDDHDRAEKIGNDGDPEGRGPVPELHDLDPFAPDRDQQHDSRPQEQACSDGADNALHDTAVPCRKAGNSGRQGDEDREYDDQGVGHGL